MKKFKIITLPGDGIGPEITSSAVKILTSISDLNDLEFEIIEKYVGGISIDKYGIPLTEETLSECVNADSVFLGAVGGPKWDNVEHSKKPEQARCMRVSHSN